MDTTLIRDMLAALEAARDELAIWARRDYAADYATDGAIADVDDAIARATAFLATTTTTTGPEA